MYTSILWGIMGLINMYTWGEDLSLKAWVVTHKGTSDVGRCLTLEHVNDY